LADCGVIVAEGTLTITGDANTFMEKGVLALTVLGAAAVLATGEGTIAEVTTGVGGTLAAVGLLTVGVGTASVGVTETSGAAGTVAITGIATGSTDGDTGVDRTGDDASTLLTGDGVVIVDGPVCTALPLT